MSGRSLPYGKVGLPIYFLNLHYNEVGNRTHTIDAEQRVTTYTYDSLYRLLQTENTAGETQNQSYDALSRRLSSADAANTVTRYQYDSLNRLITTTLNYQDGEPVDNQTNIQLSVSYDALSRRTQHLGCGQSLNQNRKSKI